MQEVEIQEASRFEHYLFPGADKVASMKGSRVIWWQLKSCLCGAHITGRNNEHRDLTSWRVTIEAAFANVLVL